MSPTPLENDAPCLTRGEGLEADFRRFTHDAVADTYDQKVRVAVLSGERLNYIRENYFNVQATVLESAQLEDGLKVLDIGIGTALMWETCPVNVLLTGVDISPRMLNKAAKKGVSATLSLGHFLQLPFPERSFDRIVSTFAFHHVRPEDKLQAYQEMLRVLRPEGRIVIGDLAFKDPAQKEEVEALLRKAERQDVLGSIRDEYYTGLSALRTSLHPLGYSLTEQRLATLTWVFSVYREG